VGQQVIFTNASDVTHSLISADGTLNSDNLLPGDSWSFTPICLIAQLGARQIAGDVVPPVVT
jgi:hypothetical protein